jgi:group I intron endonuclease
MNGKVYIGQTTGTAKQRWATHVYAAKDKCRLLGRAIKKHGPQAFTVETLQACPDRETLDGAERFFIWACKGLAPHGYNLSTGGESGFKQSPETCALKSARQHRRYEDPAQRDRQSTASRAHWSRPEVKAKASASHAAYWTPENRAKHSALIGDRSREWLKVARLTSRQACITPVVVTPLGGGESMSFGSATEACGALGLVASCVSLCIQGKQKHHKGYVIPGELTMASFVATFSGISAGEDLRAQAGEVRNAFRRFDNFTDGVINGSLPCSTITFSAISATDAVRASAEVTATTSGNLGTVINGTTVTTTFATSADVTATAAVADINANTTVNKLVIASKSGTGKFVLTALVPGIFGNCCTLTVTGTGASATGAGKLIGGTGLDGAPVTFSL